MRPNAPVVLTDLVNICFCRLPVGTWRSNLAAQGRVVFEALPAGGLAYLLAKFEGWTSKHEAPAALLICADEERAEQHTVDLQALGLQGVALLPGQEPLPFDEVTPDPRVVFGRFSLRHKIAAGQTPVIVVASVNGIAARWLPQSTFQHYTQVYRAGHTINRDALTEHLVRCGYLPVSFVEDEGTFAIRGGVVDVFVPDTALPVRLDLFGDEIDSIKTFSPDSQRTHEAFAALCVYPIREVIFDAPTIERAQTFLRDLGETVALPTRRLRSVIDEIGGQNYFYGVESLWPAFYEASDSPLDILLGPETFLCMDDPPATEAALNDRFARTVQAQKACLERHRPCVGVAAHMTCPAALSPLWQHHPRIEATPLVISLRDKPSRHGLISLEDVVKEIDERRRDPSRGEILDPVLQLLQRRASVIFACSSIGHAERLRELLLARRCDLPIVHHDGTRLLSSATASCIAVAPFRHSLTDVEANRAILSDVDIFAAAPKRLRRRAKKASAQSLSTLLDLQEGDNVIHQDHGIGRYLGLQRLVLGGIDGDYVHLEYADGDKLYVPVYHLNTLQRYRGGGAQVRLDKLGSKRWERAKQRVKDAVLAIAHDLLALQAARRARPGFRLAKPDAHFRAFEASFPFEETPDQQRAIDDVLTDLQKDTPMDRLVCGDVGFGKTEVALRGAYLTVLGQRQVAILVPTTVLAEQHKLTFDERLREHGVVVEVLSRFRSVKQIREILQRLREGAVDVLIGTHRLLSADVHFKNLGLLVVDEEQRFGVKHKERLKQLRQQVHVLTLSATPIPRTLHMAMVGLRDLSIIQTPPAERSAIRTEVLRFDEEVMAHAVRRELHRGGQVFVVHNRVESIQSIAHLVQRLVPEAKVSIAHGQMSADQLERIMVDFVRHETNVLVCTAIIESGIDIPSVNTMIVNRADTFGLSQLYQLRGRIGRGRDRAFAYLMLPRSDRIGKEATSRLSLLKRFSELGSGFQIATHDLDMRGAGDLLGAEQSGSIAAVGFELYTELLAEAVERVRGQPTHEAVEPDIKLPVSAVLPADYMPEPMQRLGYYQRMAQAADDAAIFDVVAEIKDVYGDAPVEVDALAEVMVIRRRLKALGAASLSASHDGDEVKIGLSFVPESPMDRKELVRRCQTPGGAYRLLPSGRLAIVCQIPHANDPRQFLQGIRRTLGELQVVGAKLS